MNLLAFDTATEVCSLGLSVDVPEPAGGSSGGRASGGERRYFLEIAGVQKHSELVMDGVDALFALAKFDRACLEGAACMEGPGSFTGLRIGFAAAKGLALALDIPLVPVPTLDCVAFPFSFWPGIVLPVIDAKSRSFFTALYRGGERLGPYLDTGMDELIKIVAAAKSAAAGIEPAGPESAAEPAGPGSGDPGPESPPLLITGPGAVMVYGPLVRAFPGAVLDPLHGRGRAAELLNLAAKRSILDNKRVSGGPLYLRKSDAELNG